MCIQASVTCRSAGAHLRVRLIVLIQNPVALQHTLPLEGIWWYDLVCDQSFLRSQRTEFDEQSANWVGNIYIYIIYICGSCQSCPTASITLGFRGPVIIRSLARLMVHPCPSYHAGLLLLQNLRPENPNQHLADLAPFVAIYIYIYLCCDMPWLQTIQLRFFQAHHSTKGNPFCGNFWVRAPSPAHHGCAHPM